MSWQVEDSDSAQKNDYTTAADKVAGSVVIFYVNKHLISCYNVQVA